MIGNQDKLLVFDCDSTLSGIEGIDELAALRGDAVKREIEQLTHKAMAGEIAIEEIFAARMDLVRPSLQECAAIGQRYIDEVEPFARSVIADLRAAGWRIAILSGGFVPVIQPLAEFLGITEVAAVPLFFDADGAYLDYGRDYPTTRNGGKPEIIRQLQAATNPLPRCTVMVGDGVSDLETKPCVTRFIGFGRYAVRDKVRLGADRFILSLSDLPDALP